MIFALRSHGEDNWYCTWHANKDDSCSFYFFAALPSEVDRDAHARWKAINPGAEA